MKYGDTNIANPRHTWHKNVESYTRPYSHLGCVACGEVKHHKDLDQPIVCHPNLEQKLPQANRYDEANKKGQWTGDRIMLLFTIIHLQPLPSSPQLLFHHHAHSDTGTWRRNPRTKGRIPKAPAHTIAQQCYPPRGIALKCRLLPKNRRASCRTDLSPTPHNGAPLLVPLRQGSFGVTRLVWRGTTLTG